MLSVSKKVSVSFSKHLVSKESLAETWYCSQKQLVSKESLGISLENVLSQKKSCYRSRMKFLVWSLRGFDPNNSVFSVASSLSNLVHRLWRVNWLVRWVDLGSVGRPWRSSPCSPPQLCVGTIDVFCVHLP